MQRKSSVKGWRAVLRKRARYAFVRILRSPGAPHEIAGGLAVGLFVAFLPVLQMPVAVALATGLGWLTRNRLSRTAAAAGVWLTNPLTAGPLYGASYLIGRPIVRLLMPSVPSELPPLDFAQVWSMGPLALQALLALLLGGVAIGVPVALVGYRIAHGLVARYQERRLQRRARLVPSPVPVLAP